MKQKTKTALKLAAVVTVLAASAATSEAKDPIDWGDSIGECYDNVLSYCNKETSGYPNSCYTETLGECDARHKNAMTQIPGTKLKAMKTSILRKAKRAPADVREINPQPIRKTN